MKDMYTSKIVINPDGTKRMAMTRIPQPDPEPTVSQRAIERVLDGWGTTE